MLYNRKNVDLQLKSESPFTINLKLSTFFLILIVFSHGGSRFTTLIPFMLEEPLSVDVTPFTCIVVIRLFHICQLPGLILKCHVNNDIIRVLMIIQHASIACLYETRIAYRHYKKGN
jgi:hypothetical protein